MSVGARRHYITPKTSSWTVWQTGASSHLFVEFGSTWYWIQYRRRRCWGSRQLPISYLRSHPFWFHIGGLSVSPADLKYLARQSGVSIWLKKVTSKYAGQVSCACGFRCDYNCTWSADLSVRILVNAVEHATQSFFFSFTQRLKPFLQSFPHRSETHLSEKKISLSVYFLRFG